MDVEKILIEQQNEIYLWKLRAYKAEARVQELENAVEEPNVND